MCSVSPVKMSSDKIFCNGKSCIWCYFQQLVAHIWQLAIVQTWLYLCLVGFIQYEIMLDLLMAAAGQIDMATIIYSVEGFLLQNFSLKYVIEKFLPVISYISAYHGVTLYLHRTLALL